jgi:rhodanese-related sulfurtransferase
VILQEGKMKSWRKQAFILAVLGSVVMLMAVSALAAELQHIKPEDLKELLDNKDSSIVVVDTQPKGAYDLGHIKGAINFPWAMELKSSGNLPKNKTLILYCDCSHEEDSTDVANQLMKKWGYTNLKILEGGWSKWQSLGYPIDKK